jgi:hypothetical protein
MDDQVRAVLAAVKAVAPHDLYIECLLALEEVLRDDESARLELQQLRHAALN